MATTQEQFDAYMELVEQTITARNIEEYAASHPEEIIPPPPIPYAEVKVTAFQAFTACVKGLQDSL